MADTWLDACARSNAFVDPLDHLLTDPAAEQKFDFNMRTSYERAQHRLLLTDCTVYFTPGQCSVRRACQLQRFLHAIAAYIIHVHFGKLYKVVMPHASIVK